MLKLVRIRSVHTIRVKRYLRPRLNIFGKDAFRGKSPAAPGGHFIEVDCNVIENLHFMHFCTIAFEEGGGMTDILLERPLTLLTFRLLILLTIQCIPIVCQSWKGKWDKMKGLWQLPHWNYRSLLLKSVRAMQTFLPPARKRGWGGVEMKRGNQSDKTGIIYVIVANNWIGNVKVWSKDKEPPWKLVEKEGVAYWDRGWNGKGKHSIEPIREEGGAADTDILAEISSKKNMYFQV